MYLRVWHDNSGQGKMKSWYLNHVIIRDVQTDKKYNFIANRWWAVEEDDGQVIFFFSTCIRAISLDTLHQKRQGK